MAAAKSGFPNSLKMPPVQGKKNNMGKGSFPNMPAMPSVKAGGKTSYPNAGAGIKVPGKATAAAPSVKAPVKGPSGSNVMPKVGGLLGNLRVGKLR